MPRPFCLIAALLFSAPVASAQQPASLPDANAIMARVAANQDIAIAARSRFVYLQHARVSSRKGKTIRCEEITDTRVTPTATGSHQQMLKLDGRVLYKGRYLTYTTLDGPKGLHAAGDKDDDAITIRIDNDTETDRDLVENMRKNLTAKEKSRDGFDSDLFPLTSESQKNMLFRLVGREPKNGRDTFHIVFEPKDKSDFSWKGDAWIDAAAFQPVVVRTAMSRKIPFAVRTLLGTSLPGLGFTVIYAPEPAERPEALWFPVSFGTEFKLRVLFFFDRQIVLSAENRDFETTHTSVDIRPGSVVDEQQAEPALPQSGRTQPQ